MSSKREPDYSALVVRKPISGKESWTYHYNRKALDGAVIRAKNWAVTQLSSYQPQYVIHVYLKEDK